MIDPADTGDKEEASECAKMHELIKEHKLQVRCPISSRGCGVRQRADGKVASAIPAPLSAFSGPCIVLVSDRRVKGGTWVAAS